MKKNCIVAQSGGPTVAINASLAGVIDGVIKSEKFDKIYGSVHGIQGVLKNNFLDLTDSSELFIKELTYSPAMYLGSCRFKLPDMETGIDTYEAIFKTFADMNVGAFFYIGGNDSMDTVDKLSQYAKNKGIDILIAGVPKTIDNDLVVTDHTPGFGSAAKYIATSMREMAYDTYIYDIESVLIVEIMGRDAGWLTAASALARTEFSEAPHLIYLPETNFDEQKFIADIKELLPVKKNVIVAVSEGIHDAKGNYISATSAVADKFGHAQLSGTGKYLENLVSREIGVKVRSVEINVLQRSAAHMASKTDLEEAFLLGKMAVKFVEEGNSEFMTILTRTSNSPYQYEISHSPVTHIANKAKSVPREWINEAGNDVTEEMLTYLTPLVEGEIQLNYSNGLPSYPDISHLIP
ncbi:MAG: 6-phosphofructokinase [Lachnospiraceae bacterium]|nr:6-phosphofructokinase [Lachnospiraceae bacterium]